MAVDLTSIVLRFSPETLKLLLGEDTLALAREIDARLMESDSLRRLVLGADNGFSLLMDTTGWTQVVDNLSQRDAASLCGSLGLTGPNSYELLDEYRFAQQNEVHQRRTLNFFNVELPEEPHVETVQSVTRVNPEYGLFDHQRFPAQEVLRNLKKDDGRCILHLPTGGGKTRTSMVVVCRWLLENPGSCVVWLASSRELLEQASAEFERAWSKMGDREIEILRAWGSADLDAMEYEDTFVVGGLLKMSMALRNRPEAFTALLSKVSLVVFDEAHQALAPTYQQLVEFLVGENRGVALLGLTATPGRTPHNEEQDQHLAEFFSFNRVTISMSGFANPIDYLTAEGYLAHATYIDVKYEADGGVAGVTSRQLDEIDDDLLEELGDDQLRNAELVRAAIALSERHQRILLFAPSVKSARQISLVLRALSIDSYSLDGTTSDLLRRTLVEKFRGNSSGCQVLCNFGVLTTGFDAPRTSCVIIGRPTKSVVLYSQMVGRAIRGLKVGGNQNADIVTVVDTSLRGFGAVSEGFAFWNHKWW